MTRNDTFFKILFAIEIALLPLIMASYIFTINTESKWVVGLFVAGALAVKIWLEIFKNKSDKNHIIINSISNMLTVASLVIFFTIYGLISNVVCVFVVLLTVLVNILKIVLHDRVLPEIINAVDSCFTLFECLFLIGLCLNFIIAYDFVTNISLFALLLTSAVSVLYKLYYLAKYHGLFDRIKNTFRRK